jgi:NIMA (never in mitosis gene a)-related kinase
VFVQILCRKEISYLKMSQKEREQLQAELSILKELRHPNIVQYLERDHLKSTLDLHLYMEFCGNGDLGQVIMRHKNRAERISEDFVWSVLTQLATALYRCHYGVNTPADINRCVLDLPSGHDANSVKAKKNGQFMIIHRDLKPENGRTLYILSPRQGLSLTCLIVFLDSDNNVKLGDFGLSKIIKSHDFASTYVGTPYYMSPEICAAEKYTSASDIWSLGCLIYEMCTWAPPFNARSHCELFTKIKAGKVAPLPVVYSSELQKVINSCLQVNPTNRPEAKHILSLPMVRVKRQEHEVVKLGKEVALARDAFKKERAAHQLENNKICDDLARQRAELDGQLRREWELKARLEIDRQVKLEMDRLQNIFETELGKRVAMAVQERLQAQQASTEESRRSSGESIGGLTYVETSGSASQESHKSAETSFGMGRLSLDSPAANVAPTKRSTRTPFTRAHTMGVNTIQSPIDVDMVDPSPMSIASLALSPRKDGGAAAASRQNTNIFAAAEQRWQPTNASTLDSPAASDVDTSATEDNDDDDDSGLLASPTRDPFKAMQKRPNLGRQQTLPVTTTSKRMMSAPTIFAKNTAAIAMVKRPASAVPIIATSPSRRPGESPTRARPASKIAEAISPARKTAASQAGAALKGAGHHRDEGMIKTAMRNQMHGVHAVHGRTLVELAQARAGGVVRDKPTDRAGENGRYAEPPPTWDPERDEMPSPFLARAGRGLRPK